MTSQLVINVTGHSRLLAVFVASLTGFKRALLNGTIDSIDSAIRGTYISYSSLLLICYRNAVNYKKHNVETIPLDLADIDNVT